MTEHNPATGNDTGLPTLSDLHSEALILSGLIEAMDRLSDTIGPKGSALFACIVTAAPLAKKLADDLERARNEHANTDSGARYRLAG